MQERTPNASVTGVTHKYRCFSTAKKTTQKTLVKICCRVGAAQKSSQEPQYTLKLLSGVGYKKKGKKPNQQRFGIGSPEKELKSIFAAAALV